MRRVSGRGAVVVLQESAEALAALDLTCGELQDSRRVWLGFGKWHITESLVWPLF